MESATAIKPSFVFGRAQGRLHALWHSPCAPLPDGLSPLTELVTIACLTDGCLCLADPTRHKSVPCSELSTQRRCSPCRLQYHRMVDSGNSPITSLTEGGLEEGQGYRSPSPQGVQQAESSQGERQTYASVCLKRLRAERLKVRVRV